MLSRQRIAAVVVVAALVLIPLPDPAMTAEDTKALFFARCANERLNPADFRLGAMVDDGAGISLLVASSDAKIVECAASPGSVSSVVADMSIAQMRPNLIRALGGVGSADVKRFLGYGRVSPEVTAVEFILPDGRTLVATVVGETFAYSAPYLSDDDMRKLVARAKDRTGTVVFEGKIY